MSIEAVGHNFFEDADGSWASQKFFEVWLLRSHIQLSYCILSQIYPVYILPHSFKVLFNVIIYSTPWSNKISFPFSLSD